MTACTRHNRIRNTVIKEKIEVALIVENMVEARLGQFEGVEKNGRSIGKEGLSRWRIIQQLEVGGDKEKQVKVL